WLFSTVLRAHLEHGGPPGAHTQINGWVLDPDRKKKSKSKGNVLTPMPLGGQVRADGPRYWAGRGAARPQSSARPGQMKVGRRLAVKVLNASKFVLGLGSQAPSAGDITEALDQAMLAQLAAVVDEATESFAGYSYHRALERTEEFFWRFCDDYLELVKVRAFRGRAAGRAGPAGRSLAPSRLRRAFSPF